MDSATFCPVNTSRPVTILDKSTVLAGLFAVWDDIAALAAGLDDAQWQAPTALPGWTLLLPRRCRLSTTTCGVRPSATMCTPKPAAPPQASTETGSGDWRGHARPDAASSRRDNWSARRIGSQIR